MNKLLSTLLLSIFICISVFSQSSPKFDLTKDGVKPVVLTFDAGLSAYQIYTKAKTWNASMVKYPQSAIRVDKESTQLKFGGNIEEAWKIRDNSIDHWYPLVYTLNVEIKDGRCRVTFETEEVRYKVWYNADGSTIPKFKDSEASFEASINLLLSSLNTHIKDVPKKVEDNW